MPALNSLKRKNLNLNKRRKKSYGKEQRPEEGRRRRNVMKYNFDEVIDRTNYHSEKWDELETTFGAVPKDDGMNWKLLLVLSPKMYSLCGLPIWSLGHRNR